MNKKMRHKTVTVLFAFLLGLTIGFTGTGMVSAYDPTTFTVDIVDDYNEKAGTATPKDAAEGEKVIISAYYPEAGQAFSHWESKIENFDPLEHLDNYEGISTSFSMIDNPVVLIPRYTNILVGDIPDQVYTGKAIRPDVGKVELNGIDGTLLPNSDYKVTYEKNINAGTAAARIDIYFGDNEGQCKGHIIKNFKITPADFTEADVKIGDKVYTGKAIQPDIKVTWKGQTLKKGVDYTVKCRNNVKVGTANVILTGRGNFAGKVNTTFKIKKGPAPKISGALIAKATSKGKTTVKFDWVNIKGASGYDIFFAECNHSGKKIVCRNVKSIKGNKTFVWTKSGLKKGTAYKAYIKAYVKTNGKKSYVRKSPLMHVYTSGSAKKYTNAKSVTVKKAKVTIKKNKTFKIKAKVKKLKKNKKLMPKSHAPKFRYLSSNKKVAAVSSNGKITAKGKGTCIIYVYAHNGVSKKVKVTVR